MPFGDARETNDALQTASARARLNAMAVEVPHTNDRERTMAGLPEVAACDVSRLVQRESSQRAKYLAQTKTIRKLDGLVIENLPGQLQMRVR